MYGVKNCNNVDEARYLKFCSRKKTPEPQQLPPTQAALLYHLKRVNYATAVIKRALLQHPNVPGPNGYGWQVEEDVLLIQWILRKPAPDDLVEFISCRCQSSSCCNNKCICFAHNLNCTDLCSCTDNCSNNNGTIDDDDSNENDEDSSIIVTEHDDGDDEDYDDGDDDGHFFEFFLNDSEEN